MKATKLTMIYTDADLKRERRTDFLIIETASGEIEIVRDGQPLIDADRSCAVTDNGYDVILEVERTYR